MNVWIRWSVPILSKPEHNCNDGMVRILIYEKTVSVIQTDDQPEVETDHFYSEWRDLKLYHCVGCQQQFGVWKEPETPEGHREGCSGTLFQAWTCGCGAARA